MHLRHGVDKSVAACASTGKRLSTACKSMHNQAPMRKWEACLRRTEVPHIYISVYLLVYYLVLYHVIWCEMRGDEQQDCEKTALQSAAEAQIKMHDENENEDKVMQRRKGKK